MIKARHLLQLIVLFSATTALAGNAIFLRGIVPEKVELLEPELTKAEMIEIATRSLSGVPHFLSIQESEITAPGTTTPSKDPVVTASQTTTGMLGESASFRGTLGSKSVWLTIRTP